MRIIKQNKMAIKIKNTLMGIGFGLVGLLPNVSNAQSLDDNSKVASDFINYVSDNRDTSVTKRGIEYAFMAANFGGVFYPQYVSKENSIIAAYDFDNRIYTDGRDGGINGIDSVKVADGEVDEVYNIGRKGLSKLEPNPKYQEDFINLMRGVLRKGGVEGYERKSWKERRKGK
jgi:hypothetical protein